MCQQSKSAFLLVTLFFYWCKWILKINILSQILLTLLTFIAFQIFRNGLICCVRLLFSVCYYVNVQIVSRRVIDWFHYGEQHKIIWVGMSSNNIHLLPFQIQGHLQKRGLWMPVYQNSFRTWEKSCTTSVAFHFFLIKIIQLTCHSEYFELLWSLPFKSNHQMHYQKGSFLPKWYKIYMSHQSQAWFLHITRLISLKILLFS